MALFSALMFFLFFLLTKGGFPHRIQRNYKANLIFPIVTIGSTFAALLSHCWACIFHYDIYMKQTNANLPHPKFMQIRKKLELDTSLIIEQKLY